MESKGPAEISSSRSGQTPEFDSRAPFLWLALGAILWLAPPPVAAERLDFNPSKVDTERQGLVFGFEVKGHYRDSDDVKFPSPVMFEPGILPNGRTQPYMRTPDPGEHTEISVVTLWLKADWGERFSAKIKADLVDLHDRNPTSGDREVDIDEVWIRWGHEVEPGGKADDWGMYAKLGKFPKFERQDDRHLESYGMLSTAFNRFEDAGLELGFDLGRVLYAKASFTQGNPLFYRDPNALAGDHGVAAEDGGGFGGVDLTPEFGTGFPILYDAEVEDFDFDNPEVGIGLGARFGDFSGNFALDLLLWAYDRDLGENVDLGGTLYGGDLDLLRGPFNALSLPISDIGKREVGANLWIYWGAFSFFGQYIDSELAGMERTGYEAEVAYAFELPFFGAAWGRTLFPYIAPAVRYSKLDPDIEGGSSMFPAPSVRWEWEKVDAGFRLGVIEDLLDLTVEWNRNEFIRGGQPERADEFLATVRWGMDWGGQDSGL